MTPQLALGVPSQLVHLSPVGWQQMLCEGTKFRKHYFRSTDSLNGRFCDEPPTMNV